MGCSSCSTSTDTTSPGCKNNGTCGTSGCNKLNVYNWLSDMELPEGQQPYNIVEVRFKGSRKEFFRNTDQIPLKSGDIVAVEGNPGHDIGLVSIAGELVRFQLKARGLDESSDQIKALYRLARPADIEKWESVKELEVETMHKARSIALRLNLKMKLSDVEYQGDGKKATFFYTAEERVDFRELIKKLAEEFRTRIEMRQIGMRQEASRLGGIGSCGRELCCSTWLTDFKIVSTSAARYQNLSLNPIKLAGQCGKLKCCLNYELDSYMEAIRDIPESNTRLETLKGQAVHRKTDIFKRTMWFSYVEENGGMASNSDNWIALHVDRVKEIMFLNKQGEKPADLMDYADVEEVQKPMDYADVVGQDSLTRMMDKKKKKKKKKNNDRRGGSTQDGQKGGQQARRNPSDRNKPLSESSPAPAGGQQKTNKGQGGQRDQKQNKGQNRNQGRERNDPQNTTQETQAPKNNPPAQNTRQNTPPSNDTGGDKPSRVRQIPPRINPTDQ